MIVNYYIDGVDFKTLNVYVEASDGLLSRPKLKAPLTVKWDEYHGEFPDLSKKYYEAREIVLSCFIKGSSKADFITKCNGFLAKFDAPGLHRLMVSVDGSEPLIYQVYLADGVDVRKEWSDTTMIGTFTVKLREPEPVKRIMKFIGPGTANFTATSLKMLNFYWGDGEKTVDISGTSQSISHTYPNAGTYYISITGDIDAITLFTTNTTTVWSKL